MMSFGNRHADFSKTCLPDAAPIKVLDQGADRAKRKIPCEDGADRIRLLGHHDELLVDAPIAKRDRSSDPSGGAELGVAGCRVRKVNELFVDTRPARWERRGGVFAYVNRAVGLQTEE